MFLKKKKYTLCILISIFIHYNYLISHDCYPPLIYCLPGKIPLYSLVVVLEGEAAKYIHNHAIIIGAEQTSIFLVLSGGR